MSARCLKRSPVPSAEGDFAPFVSAKTTSPITVRSCVVEEALVQFTLDGSVASISPGFALPSAGGRLVEVDAVLECSRGTSALLVGWVHPESLDEAAAARELASHGLPLLSLPDKEVLRDPFAANARLVWASREAAVSASDQIRVLSYLVEFGPSPLIDLEHAVRSGDAWASVMAMCCRGIIDLDLRHRLLGPYTQASCRTAC